MDLSSFNRGLSGARAAPLDYDVLLAAQRTAQAASRPAATASVESAPDAGWRTLATVVLGGENWRDAARRRGGMFAAKPARPAGNRIAIEITTPFTLAF